MFPLEKKSNGFPLETALAFLFTDRRVNIKVNVEAGGTMHLNTNGGNKAVDTKENIGPGVNEVETILFEYDLLL